MVRGGLLRTSDLERTCENTREKMQRPGISVFAADVGNPSELVIACGTRLPQPQLSFTRLGHLIDAGFEVEQTLEPPHHTVWMSEDGIDAAIELFRSQFAPPIARVDVLAGAIGG